MLRLLLVSCLVGAALAADRSDEEVRRYRSFLEKYTKDDDTTPLEDKMAECPMASAWENSGKFQGDILLTDQDVEELVADFATNHTRTAPTNRNRLWPNAIIPFEFASGHFSTAQQNTIRGVMEMYHSRTCVRFRQRTSERDFVRITGNPTGCYAHVGYYQNMGAHTHNLALNGCMHPMIIFHEFGHNVGFNHMHCANTRDNYVWINWQNMQAGTEFNFERLPNHYSDMLWLPYEYASNQHYGPYAFSRNWQPTIVARQAGGEWMGQLDFASGWDLQRVGRLYNCAGAWSGVVDERDANTPAFRMPSIEELQEMGAKFAAEEELRIQREAQAQA